MSVPVDIVCFDCDSTLSAVEGIDELASRAGVLAELEPLTTAAMEGSLSLEDIYRRRLDLIRPDQDAINWLCQQYLDEMVEGAEQVVKSLIEQGKSVHIISGGIRQAVLSVGQYLDLPDQQVHAVDVNFDSQGAYAGFDQNSPLARSKGKAEICRQLMDQYSCQRGHIALIGDGVTDLEAAEAGVYVIGFGGVARRQVMVQGASRFVDGPALYDVLELLA
jgi:phosphoserine phosphatase